MVSVPFLIGMVAGGPNWLHFLLFIGWIGFYLASYPLLQALKRKSDRIRYYRWSAGYFIAAVLFTSAPLLYEPGLLYFAPVFAMLLAVNIRYVLLKAERALANDLCAILSFSMGGGAAYLLGAGGSDATMVGVVLFSFLYFAGSAFFVKTVFRERGHLGWLRCAKGYHATIVLVAGVVWGPWMMLPFIYALFRTLRYGGHVMRPMEVGIIEIAGAVQFAILTSIFL